MLQTLGAPDVESVPLSAAVVDALAREVNVDMVSRERVLAIRNVAKALQFAITKQFTASGLNYKGKADKTEQVITGADTVQDSRSMMREYESDPRTLR